MKPSILTFVMLTGCVLFNLWRCNQPATPDSSDDSYYTEQYRPQFHFSPEANWMNDPNGMVYYDGEYHLFYQYYPDSTVWGPMHWGHAVSSDLVHWEHLPVALYPDSLGWIFSGSAVVDKGNTSGLGKNGKDPLIAIFTHHNPEMEKEGRNDFQYQSIAFSNDNGRTFTMYESNPVIVNPGIRDFRDPKVIWHDKSKNWIMVLAAYDKAMFYTSPNLKDWTLTSEFGIPGDDRLWECPDLFPMRVEGSEEEKWVLIVSIQQKAPNGGTATGYFVGDFDGKTFTGDPQNQKWLDYGTDNYALVTWSNVPDGRTLAMGWMSNWLYAQEVPASVWRSAMTLPREIFLFESGGDFFLRSVPPKELAVLKKNTKTVKAQIIADSILLMEGITTAKLNLSFDKPEEGQIIIRFSNTSEEFIDVGYNADDETYFINRTHSGNAEFYPPFASKHTGQTVYPFESINMIIYLDHSSVELFADEGKCVMTDIFFPSEPFDKAQVIVTGSTEMREGYVTEMNNIWR